MVGQSELSLNIEEAGTLRNAKKSLPKIVFHSGLNSEKPVISTVVAGTVADPGFLKGEGRGADLTEPYRNNARQNRLSDSFVPFLNFRGVASHLIRPCGMAPMAGRQSVKRSNWTRLKCLRFFFEFLAGGIYYPTLVCYFLYVFFFIFVLFIYLLLVYYLQGVKMENNYPKLKCQGGKMEKKYPKLKCEGPGTSDCDLNHAPPPPLLLDSLTLICAKCACFFKNLQQTRKFS